MAEDHEGGEDLPHGEVVHVPRHQLGLLHSDEDDDDPKGEPERDRVKLRVVLMHVEALVAEEESGLGWMRLGGVLGVSARRPEVLFSTAEVELQVCWGLTAQSTKKERTRRYFHLRFRFFSRSEDTLKVLPNPF